MRSLMRSTSLIISSRSCQFRSARRHQIKFTRQHAAIGNKRRRRYRQLSSFVRFLLVLLRRRHRIRLSGATAILLIFSAIQPAVVRAVLPKFGRAAKTKPRCDNPSSAGLARISLILRMVADSKSKTGTSCRSWCARLSLSREPLSSRRHNARLRPVVVTGPQRSGQATANSHARAPFNQGSGHPSLPVGKDASRRRRKDFISA